MALTMKASQAYLTGEQSVLPYLRHQAEVLERDADNAQMRAIHRSKNLDACVDERQRKAAIALREMRMRLQEARTVHEEARKACDARLNEARQLLQNDCLHHSEVKAALQRERASTAAIWEQVAEVENESDMRLAARDRDVEKTQVDMQKRVDTARQIAEGRIREVEGQCAETLRVANERLVVAEEACRARVEKEAARKGQSDEALSKHRAEAENRRNIDNFCTKVHLEQRRMVDNFYM